jgi:kynurenine formamidase
MFAARPLLSLWFRINVWLREGLEMLWTHPGEAERRSRRGARRLPVLAATVVLGAASPSASPPLRDLSQAKVVDLTHPFDDKTLYWPTSPSGFELKRLSFGETPGGWFYAANSLCMPEHGGTHVDEPIHFDKEGKTVDLIPPRQLIAPGVVIDVSAQAAADPDYRLSLEDLRSWEKLHGNIPAGAIVLLRTGWGKRWPDRKRYLGDDTPGDASKLHFPSYGKESAEHLVRQRHVAALGVDTASIDYGASKDFIVHRIASAAGVPGLNLEQLPMVGAWVIALPMKIAGGSGGPLRIVALVSAGGDQHGR